VKRWVMLDGQPLPQWHLIGEPAGAIGIPGQWKFIALCGLSLGNDPARLKQMTDKQLVDGRCAACAEKSLEA
jgi:hypothetical protein